jgi:hypothetical protein
VAGSTPVLVHNNDGPVGDACPIDYSTVGFPNVPKKAVSFNGTDFTASGNSAQLPAGGIVRPTEPQMTGMAQAIGYDYVPSEASRPGAAYLDNGQPGSYNLWHAEKQGSVLNPGASQAVNRPVCDDCFEWMQKQAVYLGQSIYVTDPWGQLRFDPDGTWTEVG